MQYYNTILHFRQLLYNTIIYKTIQPYTTIRHFDVFIRVSRALISSLQSLQNLKITKLKNYKK